MSRENLRFLEEFQDLKADHHSLDRNYIEVDGHLCPTRDEKKDKGDHGFREAKAVIAFNGKDVAELSKDRNEITTSILKAKITPANDFSSIFKSVYEFSQAANAQRIVALADGAHWIWNMFEEIVPEAIQILDFSHAKSYLYQAADLIYGKCEMGVAWVKKQEDLLFEDKVNDVIENIKIHSGTVVKLNDIVTYFDYNRYRMLYGTYKKQGLCIGSGAVESAGKRLAQGRIKGGGMRWNIKDLNKFLKLRCAWLDSSWNRFWDIQKMAA